MLAKARARGFTLAGQPRDFVASKSVIHVGFLILLSAILFFHGLTSRDLWGSHEARAAQDAGSMLHAHDWTMPRLTDERLDLQKPPMYYWLVAAAASLRGGDVDAWATRLPAAIAALLTVLLVYFALASRGRTTAALLAAIILASAQHFTWLARTARIDMPLTLCVSAAILSIGMSRRWRAVGHVVIAIGILLKGPIGLVLPVAALAGFAIAQRMARDESRFLRSLWWGIPLAIVIAAPWFVWANMKTQGEFFRLFFWYHNVERALGGSGELAEHPWWYYGPRLLVDALPWSVLILPAIVWLVRGNWRGDCEARLGGVWLLAIVSVLSCAKFKRADYLLPGYPGMAILLGCAGERALSTLAAWRQRTAFGAIGVIVAGVMATWLWLIHVEYPRLERFRESASFAQRVREVAPAPAPVLFFRVESHALALHLRRPINTFLEWENLDWWVAKPEAQFVLMPPEAAAEWRQHLKAGRLEEVFRNTDFTGGRHEKPVVLMRTRSNLKDNHVASRQQTIGSPRIDQHGLAGAKSRGTTRTSPPRLDLDARQAQPPVRDPGGG